MARKTFGELFEIYSDFWLGVASTGARGFADITKALQERSEERRHNLVDVDTIASGVNVLLQSARSSLEDVARAAETVRDDIKKDSRVGPNLAKQTKSGTAKRSGRTRSKSPKKS